MSVYNVLKVLKEKTPGAINLSPLDIFVLDEKYPYKTKAELESKLKWSFWKFLFYIKEVNDCDDFALKEMTRLRGLGVGMVLSGSHAFNIFVDDKKKIWFFEPQNGKIMSLAQIKLNKQYYPIRLILI